MPRLQRDLRFAPTGFVGYWILLIMDAPYLIRYRVSKIEYLALYGSNVNAVDIFIFGSGLPGLGFMEEQLETNNLSPGV
ncbi:MAG: hypothetical protein GY797_07125 [Deltaproteobacteria bacterium]|nr:hypothetical protein [Deltaproteobacteria bacterium]